MADNIDIEEHDILLNPRMKGYLSALTIKDEPKEDCNEFWDNGSTVHYGDSTSSSSNKYMVNEEIILHSKPPKCPRYVATELMDLSEQRKIVSAFVLLEDWMERLSSSSSYCNLCGTLFATQNALKIHNTTAHSLLAPGETVENPKGIECSHCNIYFTDEASLIAHMYKIIEHQSSKQPTFSNKVVKNTYGKRETAVSKSEIASKSEMVKDKMEETKQCVYTCPICKYVLKKKNKMKTHVSKKHSLDRYDSEPAPFQNRCGICLKEIHINFNNHHIKKYHIQEYKKKVTKDYTISLNTKDGAVCYVSGSEINRGHPNRCSEVTLDPKPKNTALPQYKEWVPKDVIFRCSICSLHFLNSVVALLHFSSHKNGSTSPTTTSTWECSQCERVFPKTERNGHITQHKVGENIKCFDYGEDLCSRVLCKCPKCSVYMMERQFFKHKSRGCDYSVWKYCSICDIDVNEFEMHLQKHGSVENFILIDEYINPDDEEESGSIEESSEDDTLDVEEDKYSPDYQVKVKKVKLDCNSTQPTRGKEVKFFQCTLCLSVSKKLSFVSAHVQCYLSQVGKKCPKCGIVLRNMCYPLHIKWHNMNPNITKDSIVIAPFTKGKLSNPGDGERPYYPHYQCNNCKVLLVIKKTHKCHSFSTKICPICKYKIPVRYDFQLHMKRHEDGMMRENMKMFVFNNKENNANAETMFKCARCKCVFLDRVDFCRHFKRNQCHANSGRRCEECGVSFHHKALERHKRNLLEDVKLDIVTLHKSGIKDYTLFLCKECDIHFLNRPTFRLHVKRNHSNKRSEKCPDCGLNISKVLLEAHITLHHKEENYKLDDFNIVCPKIEGSVPLKINNAMRNRKMDKTVQSSEEEDDCDGTKPKSTNKTNIKQSKKNK